MIEDEDLLDSKHELEFYIQRNIRYHERRMSFFSKANRFITFLTILLGSGTAITVISQFDIDYLAIIFGITTTILATIELVVGTNNFAWMHRDFKRQYIDLESEIYDQSDKLTEKIINDIWIKVRKIEANEPPTMPAVEKLAQNDVVRSIYKQEELDEYLSPMCWLKRETANFLYWNTTNMLSKHEKKKQNQIKAQ